MHFDMIKDRIGSTNMYLSNNGFGNFTRPIVEELLENVDLFFARNIGMEPFSSKNVFISFRDDVPECCDAPGAGHVIFLSSKENYWCQWVFQFSHEYCHHLIDGKLSDVISGLLWLEESICRVSSLCNLVNAVSVCEKSEYTALNAFAIQMKIYILSHLHPALPAGLGEGMLSGRILPSISAQKIILSHQEVLSRKYDDHLYCQIAYAIVPHFHNNPKLWKILPHIGDSHSWQSLDALYQHLAETADDSYRDSLSSLFRCLGVSV